jgi:hypothetical protein|eukprot:SAG25_NODE_5_length_29351_cov_43.404335_29_plen_115_part_00
MAVAVFTERARADFEVTFITPNRPVSRAGLLVPEPGGTAGMCWQELLGLSRLQAKDEVRRRGAVVAIVVIAVGRVRHAASGHVPRSGRLRARNNNRQTARVAGQVPSDIRMHKR